MKREKNISVSSGFDCSKCGKHILVDHQDKSQHERGYSCVVPKGWTMKRTSLVSHIYVCEDCK